MIETTIYNLGHYIYVAYLLSVVITPFHGELEITTVLVRFNGPVMF